jgi:septum formation protein
MNTFINPSVRVVLASGSQSRAGILRSTGMPVDLCPSGIIESLIKEAFAYQGKSAGETAMALAVAKAQDVSQKCPGAYVIGADSLMDCEGTWFDRAQSVAEARSQLQRLVGKTHTLETAVCVVKDGQAVWSHLASPQLKMRSFSQDFLNRYVGFLGEKLLQSVGCYQVEGLGIHLFEEIRGDIFTIMGLPLLPLLAYFRDEGVVLK